MPFASLGLSPSLSNPLARLGYTTPTPVQLKSIPIVLTGSDLLAKAQTGTGKTAAFGLPMIDRLLVRGGAAAGTRKPRGLVLVPTRELALQVHKSLSTYGVPANLRVTAIFGGVSIVPQKKELLRGTDIIVATPGRLLDHMEQRTVDLSGIQILCARRSRSHARHGLPAAAAPHPEGAAARSADAAVLGDDLRRSGPPVGGLHARRRSASMSPRDRRWPRP